MRLFPLRLFPLRKALLASLIPASLILLTLSALPTVHASTDPELKRLLKDAIESDSGFDDRFDAQVWLLDMSRRLEKYVPDPKTRIEILKQVHYEATRVSIEPELVLALIEVESHFNEYAISVSGARGLMQVMPFWLDEIGISDKNLFKIRTNLRMGCTILRYYMDMEPDDLGRALARYNGSLGRTDYPNKVIEALHRNWFKQ
jgi:soluble lytic murein transglycosylase-like protein